MIPSHFFTCFEHTKNCPRYQHHVAGEEQLVQLNEANHVEGHLAELDATVYWTYCEHQRDRFRYLEVPWWQPWQLWQLWHCG